MKCKILYISMCLPFDKAFHAGGKTFNYYINSFANDESNEVTLIAKVLPDEEKYISTLSKKIRFYKVASPRSGIKKYIAYAKSINSKINPLYRYGNTLTYDIYKQIEDCLRLLKSEKYKPDVVVLEWTQMLLFIDRVKDFFPSARYVASEHDVTFLGKERKYKSAKGLFKRTIARLTYENIKRRELEAINNCDLVFTHNHKDRRLLIENNISPDKIDVIVPYYDVFYVAKRSPVKGNIIFYGAMNRVENYSSAIWFIENVMPLLDAQNITFTVIGNKPPRELIERQGKNIIITGFVDDPTPYFESAMCLVAPLLLGAGVKVKIIEALSSGVPVLTNDIGIEGIDAVDGEQYFNCSTPEEYYNIICKMLCGQIDCYKVTNKATVLIKEQYDLKESLNNYKKRLYELIG